MLGACIMGSEQLARQSYIGDVSPHGVGTRIQFAGRSIEMEALSGGPLRPGWCGARYVGLRLR